MKRNLILSVAALAAFGAGLLSTTAEARGPWGMMGPGMGMMGGGPGMAMGANQNCPRFQAATGQEITVDSVRGFFEGRLAMHNNPNVKLGTVAQKDDKTIVAEIVTKDGSLVRRIEIDKTTGRHTPVQ
ncbi:MAG: hypothetical protein H7841_15850 [Magnetospirillum sp. WYHS-4]